MVKRESNFIYFDEIDSTNEYAKKIAQQSPAGTVVIAETQKKGKGRFGRTWASPRGGIWMSIILKPRQGLTFPTLFTLFAGLAVVRALKLFGLNANLKWPNDILVEYKKIGGILFEGEPESNSIIVGIGLNVNFKLEALPPAIRETATTIVHELNRVIDKKLLIEDIIIELKSVYARFEKEKGDTLLDEWKRYSNSIGQEVAVKVVNETIEGKIVDIDTDGSLVLEERTGTIRKIIAGEVKIIK